MRDPVIENKILKGLNRRVRDRLIAPTRRRTYWLKKEAGRDNENQFGAVR